MGRRVDLVVRVQAFLFSAINLAFVFLMNTFMIDDAWFLFYTKQRELRWILTIKTTFS